MTFSLLSELGRGGMGVVWRARDEETGQIVALKLLRAVYADDPDYLERFSRELELTRRIHSAHVVPVLGYGVREGIPYLALAYVDGPSLREHLAEHGPYAWPAARVLLAQVAGGLADAHAVGIVHRDVKPSNILLGADGLVKLTDFGVSRGLDLTRVTGTSTMLGTPAYLAPEGPADERSDLYSLGCVAYELLAGAVPFEGRSYQEVILRHVREAPDLTRLPAAARPIVGALLAKEPARRPGSAAALVGLLEEPPRMLAAAPPSRRRPRAALIGAAILALAISAVAVSAGLTASPGPASSAGTPRSTEVSSTATPTSSLSPTTASATPTFGPSPTLTQSVTPWTTANPTVKPTVRPTTFQVGDNPDGVVFDGKYIWVASSGSQTVTKLIATTGAVVGTYRVGVNPRPIAFDGTNIWVGNSFNPGSVTKLVAATGAVVGTYGVDPGPKGIAFGNGYIWVAAENAVIKLAPSTGAIVATHTVFGASGVVIEGPFLWVTSLSEHTVTKLDEATITVMGTYGVGRVPEAVMSDGTSIWVANSGSANVTKLDAASGSVIGTYAVGSQPVAVMFDGKTVWVANNGSTTAAGSVMTLDPATGAIVRTYRVAGAPNALAWDGAYTWVTTGGNTVTKLIP